MKQILYNKEQFIKEYINYIDDSTVAMSKNNYKLNNRIVKKFIKFIEEQSSKEFFHSALNELIESQNLEISISAATNSLKYNMNIDKSINLLTTMAKRNDIGIAALEAEMTLKVYNGEIPNRTL